MDSEFVVTCPYCGEAVEIYLEPDVRGTLVQLATPPAMRGRVGAVNVLFIGASNELGEFESGVTAALLGTVPAVVLGGLGTCVIVALFAWWFPELRKVESLSE